MCLYCTQQRQQQLNQLVSLSTAGDKLTSQNPEVTGIGSGGTQFCLPGSGRNDSALATDVSSSAVLGTSLPDSILTGPLSQTNTILVGNTNMPSLTSDSNSVAILVPSTSATGSLSAGPLTDSIPFSSKPPSIVPLSQISRPDIPGGGVAGCCSISGLGHSFAPLAGWSIELIPDQSTTPLQHPQPASFSAFGQLSSEALPPQLVANFSDDPSPLPALGDGPCSVCQPRASSSSSSSSTSTEPCSCLPLSLSPARESTGCVEPVGESAVGAAACPGPDQDQLACARLIRQLASEILVAMQHHQQQQHQQYQQLISTQTFQAFSQEPTPQIISNPSNASSNNPNINTTTVNDSNNINITNGVPLASGQETWSHSYQPAS
ncbi:unnamed protein product [Protopolystoma xenopodis]|uniref:Uncharacterized protein n=1 Tax=Protopolystoma xenopodis TaxID=117903 RepID=A0A448WE30_9PLAT|nr:unnamed protein product [Protopolystoma xenopodis]